MARVKSRLNALRALTGAVVSQRDAEVRLRQPDGSQLHLKGVDVSHPFSGGLQGSTPDGRVTTYSGAASVAACFGPASGCSRACLCRPPRA